MIALARQLSVQPIATSSAHVLFPIDRFFCLASVSFTGRDVVSLAFNSSEPRWCLFSVIDCPLRYVLRFSFLTLDKNLLLLFHIFNVSPKLCCSRWWKRAWLRQKRETVRAMSFFGNKSSQKFEQYISVKCIYSRYIKNTIGDGGSTAPSFQLR